MKTILIVAAFVPRYRVAFFERLRDTLGDEHLSLRVAYGAAPAAGRYASHSAESHLSFGRRTTSYWLFGGRVLLQPVFDEIRRADLVIVEQANKHLLNYLLLFLSALRMKRVAFWGHGWNRQGRNPSSLSERLKARLIRRPDWWFAYTESTACYLQSNGVPPDTVTVVQNSIDVKHFQRLLAGTTGQELDRTRALLRIESEAKVGLFCGSLYSDKKLAFLLHAAEKIRDSLPSFHLVVIGEGPERRLVEASTRGKPWVHFVGFKQGREKAVYFRLAHVVLNPGAVGLGIMDAFASGLPFITTDVALHGPEIDYFENGKNGMMCEHRSSSYARMVVDLLRDRSLYDRLSAGALAAAEERSLEAMVQNFTTGILACMRGTSRGSDRRAAGGHSGGR
jgi:glycosyltransferase involved in cell wall biosynthesis